MVTNELDMNKETVRNILIQVLGMRKLSEKLVLQNLMEEQKDGHLILCVDFAKHLQEDNFLDRVITGGETWCYWYDSEAKCQSMEWKLKNFPVQRSHGCQSPS
jgi:hypothetical protein